MPNASHPGKNDMETNLFFSFFDMQRSNIIIVVNKKVHGSIRDVFNGAKRLKQGEGIETNH